MKKEIKERDVLAYLKKRVKALGGEVRRVKWIGRNFAPDVRVWIPGELAFWVETKRRKGRLAIMQEREHRKMEGYGERVEVWYTIEQLDFELNILVRR